MAAITDVVDGWLARRMGLVTVIGKFLDPLADKLIVLAAMVMLVRLGRLPAWVAILLLSREFIVTGLRQIAASEGMVIAAGQEGKWKTALQLVGVVALLVHYQHEVDLWVWQGPVNFNAVGQVLTYLSVVFSLWSARRLLPRLPADARPPGRRKRIGRGLNGLLYRVVNPLKLTVWKAGPSLGRTPVWANASMLA